MEVLKQAVSRQTKAWASASGDAGGLIATLLPDVHLVRVPAPTPFVPEIYRPVVCLVLQGAKQVVVREEVHDLVAGQSVIVGLDAPLTARVVRATGTEPYLALAMDLDMGVMREVMAHVASPASAAAASRPGATLFAEDTREAVADCALRLVRLLDRPEAVPLLHPSIVKEMHYWLLAGQHGAAIRRMAEHDGHAQRVARAVARLRAGFMQPIPVAHLAAAAGMSVSSFHQHFKAATSLSPLQFQKQLRLLEARRLMLGGEASASQAAHAVGYESVPQFTREYGRMFGVPPRRDAAASRAAA